MSGKRAIARPPSLLMAAIAAAALLNLLLGFYWITSQSLLTGLSSPPARLFAAVASADHGFYDRPGQLELGLIADNLVIGSALYAALLLAWARGWRSALPLALATAAVQCYAILATLWCGLLDGLPNLDRTAAAATTLFALAGGWFALHLLLGLDSLRRLARLGWGRYEPATPLSRSDRWVLGLTIFFVVMALTVELPWLLASAELDHMSGPFGAMWAFYGRADRGYFDLVSGLERGVESFHIFATQWLHLWLVWAILRRWTYRFVLQLVVGSYVAFSTALYLFAKHMTGYALMPDHTAGAFLTLYLANLPWLIGNAWIAIEGGRGLIARLPRQEAVR
jgi:hypothetical protein